jgi:hypothetical protein
MTLLLVDIPDKLFTWESLVTLAGATAATMLVTNVLRSLTNWSAKWIGFITAMIIALACVIFGIQAKPADYFIAILNGFLIYATAAGGMQITGSPATTKNKQTDQEMPSKKFWSKWY